MKSPTEQLIDLVERLRPTGEIGDGMVAQFHDLAARARAEQARVRSSLRALQENDPAEPIADNGATVLDAVRAEALALFGKPRRPFLNLGSVCVPMVEAPDGSIRFG